MLPGGKSVVSVLLFAHTAPPAHWVKLGVVPLTGGSSHLGQRPRDSFSPTSPKGRPLLHDRRWWTLRLLPWDSVEDPLSPTARDVVSTIVDRAEGVFLWVRLVRKSLLDAGPDVRTLQLKELLQALPNGLEELYERTIERIPRTCRLEAFIVLEIVNR